MNPQSSHPNHESEGAMPAIVPPATVPLEVPQPEPEQTETLPGLVYRRLPGWRFWLPLGIQIALIVVAPMQNALTYAFGREVVLQTAPVDPYDPLRGYSQTLSYEISRTDTLQKLPGGKELFSQTWGPDFEFYVVLEAPTVEASPPKAWKPVRISRDRPTDLAPNQVALQGRRYQGFIKYGLETYYMPEDQRDEINQDIFSVGQDQQAFVVEVKVDGQGHAIPVSLWVRDRNYRF